jgi:hypothetical protein
MTSLPVVEANALAHSTLTTVFGALIAALIGSGEGVALPYSHLVLALSHGLAKLSEAESAALQKRLLATCRVVVEIDGAKEAIDLSSEREIERAFTSITVLNLVLVEVLKFNYADFFDAFGIQITAPLKA